MIAREPRSRGAVAHCYMLNLRTASRPHRWQGSMGRQGLPSETCIRGNIDPDADCSDSIACVTFESHPKTTPCIYRPSLFINNSHSTDRGGIYFLASVQTGFTPADLLVRAGDKSHQKTALQGQHLSTNHDGVASP